MKDYGQDVPPVLLAEYESWLDHDYAFILSNGRRHYALSVISNLPQNHFSDLFWEFEIHYPKEIFPWPREGDGPFDRDELPRGFEGSTSVSNVLTVLEYRDAQARRELNQTLAPLLDDVHTQMGRASGPLEGARLAMEHCDPIFKREAWWRAMDTGLTNAFNFLTLIYNPSGGLGMMMSGGAMAVNFSTAAAQGRWGDAALSLAMMGLASRGGAWGNLAVGSYAVGDGLNNFAQTGDVVQLGLDLLAAKGNFQAAGRGMMAPRTTGGTGQVRPATEAMGKGNSPFVEDLSHVTGKTAATRNRAIEALIHEDLSGLKLTYKPQYSPFIEDFGLAQQGTGTHIGAKSFESRTRLRDVIVHEELHHRWWERGITDGHHADPVLDARFDAVLKRYARMRGWDK